MTIFNINPVVEISRSFNKNFQLQHLYQLLFYPPRSEITRKVGHHALLPKVVCEAPKPSELSQSVVEIILESDLQEEGCFGCG